jgi:hypothetical protein
MKPRTCILTLAGLALASSAFAQYDSSPSPSPTTAPSSGSSSTYGSSGTTGSTSTTSRTSTTTSMNSYDVKNGTIVAVQGNQIVVKSSDGYRQLTVAPDYKWTINGQQMTITQLKPGMTFSSTVQTTTAPVTLTTTEMNNAEVVSASGNTVVIKDQNGMQRTFGDSDFRNMDLVLMKDGKPVMANTLKTGDHVTAVMLSEGPSTGSMGTTGTTGSTYGSMGTGSAPGSPGSTGSTGSTYGSSGATGSTGSTAGTMTRSSAASTTDRTTSDVASSSTYQDDTNRRRNLPKTASPWPLVGLAGLVLLGIGGAVTLARRLTLG